MPRPEIEMVLNFSERTARQMLSVRTTTLEGEYSVKLKPVKPTRSGRQNNFFHGPLCDVWIQHNADQGVLVTTHQTKELYKVVGCGLVERSIDPTTGELLTESFK